MLEIFGKKERGQNMQRETKVLDMHGYKSINCKRYLRYYVQTMRYRY